MEAEADHSTVLRNLLETLAGEEMPRSGANSENVAQLLAAAIAQVGQSILQVQGAQTSLLGGIQDPGEERMGVDKDTGGSPAVNLDVNPQAAAATVHEIHDTASAPSTSTSTAPSTVTATETATSCPQITDVVSTVEVPTTTEKPRPLCIKFPIELRKRIIAMRKEGKLSKDIAKELKVSVSGVQKVWERFLATGMVHDRKPSTYAGRPRKSTYSQVIECTMPM